MPILFANGFRPYVTLITIDGAFIKTIHQYVLLLVVVFDANEHSVMLAWRFAMTESEETWDGFCFGCAPRFRGVRARDCPYVGQTKRSLLLFMLFVP